MEALGVRPSDRVLEIGCGHGVAGSLICQRLPNGKYVAIDRSLKMIAAATKRNQAYVAAGIATFIHVELEKLDLGEERFDKILAMRVRLFLDQPDHARALVARWLAPSGQLFIQYDQPGQNGVACAAMFRGWPSGI
ncbi:class I SAM-dependent methyltransferase [Methylococcus sp. Mc7]|nr:class I SAM-dependent methyltransferase [Methylococcus sp. Mc7]